MVSTLADLVEWVESFFGWIAERRVARLRRQTIENALILMGIYRDVKEEGLWDKDREIRDIWNSTLDTVIERSGQLGCARIVLTIIEQKLDPTPMQQFKQAAAEFMAP